MVRWRNSIHSDSISRSDFCTSSATGDPWERMHDEPGTVDELLSWWERDVEAGLGELPFPPDFPKMPGEPPRVQPSRKNEANWPKDET